MSLCIESGKTLALKGLLVPMVYTKVAVVLDGEPVVVVVVR